MAGTGAVGEGVVGEGGEGEAGLESCDLGDISVTAGCETLFCARCDPTAEAWRGVAAPGTPMTREARPWVLMGWGTQ